MEYILTEDDINRYNLLGASAGDVALPEELKMMGMDAPAVAPADPTFGGDPVYTAARNAGADVDEAVMAQDPTTQAGADIRADTSLYTRNVSMPSAVSTMGGASSSMMDLLSTPVPQDPFENLSRNQRMMLGFAAMKDAGMALMGKDSTAVAGVMGDFTERANMERKRRAALAGLEAERQQRAALAGLFGGGDASGGYTPDLSTPDGVRAHIARLTQYAASNPEGAAGVVPEIQRLQGEVERITAAQGEVQSGQMMLGQLDALIFDPDLERALGIEGFLRRVPAELGLDSDTARVRARIDQIKGGAFLQAFESLKGGGQITEIEGQKAEQAEARLSTAQDLGDFAEALKEYRFYIDQGVRRKMGEDIPLDTLYRQEQPASGAGESLEDFKIRMGIKT
jgi:hypothetical protein